MLFVSCCFERRGVRSPSAPPSPAPTAACIGTDRMARAARRNGGPLAVGRLGALFLALFACWAPPAAAAEKITLRFEVYGLMGLRVLTLRTQLEQQGDRYVVTAEYATAGIAGLVSDQATHAVARGRLIPGSAEPESFVNVTRHSRTEYRSRVDYKPDGSIVGGVTPACNMTRYNRHVDEGVQNAGARQGTFWYAALLPGGDIMVPVRMRLRTQIGTVDVYLSEVQGRGVDLRL